MEIAILAFNCEPDELARYLQLVISHSSLFDPKVYVVFSLILFLCTTEVIL